MCISLLCPLYNCGCTRKQKACSSFGKDHCSGADWFHNSFQSFKKSLRICACFENQELLNVFTILHSIDSCTFNLQVFLIRREKVTLDLRGLSLSKGKKIHGGIIRCVFWREFLENICLSKTYSSQLSFEPTVSKSRSRNYFRKDVMCMSCPGVSVLTEAMQIIQIIKYTNLLLQITFPSCIRNPNFLCWLKRMTTLEYLHSELC